MSPGQLPAVREACVETFTLRATHSWPPTVTIFDGWESGYAALAAELDFPLRDVHQAGDAVQAMIADIDAAA
jgi:hypothetical protein